MAVPYTALVTPDDVQDLSEDSFEFDITDANTYKAVESIIQEVTNVFEGAAGLGRNLIVRQYTHYFNYHDWDYDPSRNLYYVRAPQWPVVQIDTSGFTAGSTRESFQDESNIITHASKHSGAIVYYAGYKRTEQVLSGIDQGNDLDEQPGLSLLTTSPNDLPEDIRGAAFNVILNYLAVRRFGPGQRSRTLNPAIQSTTIQEPIRDYAADICRKRINHHRKLA